MLATTLWLISDAAEIARGLCDGGFCLLRWELTDDIADLTHWKDCLVALCAENGTEIDLIDIPAKDVTVIVNPWYVPADDRSTAHRRRRKCPWAEGHH